MKPYKTHVKPGLHKHIRCQYIFQVLFLGSELRYYFVHLSNYGAKKRSSTKKEENAEHLEGLTASVQTGPIQAVHLASIKNHTLSPSEAAEISPTNQKKIRGSFNDKLLVNPQLWNSP
jgi:hypothetical protein